MDTATKFITPGIIFLLTLASGIWLSNSGKPLNTGLFNLHKLIALGAVIITAMQVQKAYSGAGSQGLIVALVFLLGLCVVALFLTGAFMSLGKLSYDMLLNIHKIAPILAAIALAATVYLLAGGQLK
ncbi:MAG: hypothetical protein EHM70_03950 [Chloroflexota bacterium]|nr:MAG: hypothetical protein EHM70_03950 [Chloroflexota bacterium]